MPENKNIYKFAYPLFFYISRLILLMLKKLSWLITIPLATVFLNSCQNSTEVTNIEKYSGEELFSSIFFLQGSVVEKLPQLVSLKEQILAHEQSAYVFQHIDTVRNLLIEDIRQQEPLFFASFQQDMQSGDHFKIESAMEKGMSVLIRASKRLTDQATEDLVNQIQEGSEEEIIEILGESIAADIEHIQSIKSDKTLLTKFLLTDFLQQSRSHDNGKKMCLSPTFLGVALVAGVVLYVVAAGAFDVAISMNLVVGMNIAIVSYSWFHATGDTGGVIMSATSIYQGGSAYLNPGDGLGDCASEDADCPEDSAGSGSSQRIAKSTQSLAQEMFINAIAENLKMR